jgi:hypothetical protein
MEHEPRDPSGEGPDGGEGGSAEGPDDALRRLEQRLDRASNAAERLIAEATAQAGASAGSHAPPSGWQAPAGDEDPGRGRDVEVLAQVLRSLRDLIPPELQRKLGEALRELLLAIRALIDWYLERVEQRRAAPAEVQDIPIL